MTFVITPLDGVNVNYDAIDIFTYKKTLGPGDGALQYSIDGGAFVDAGTITYPVDSSGAAVPELPIDLSDISALQNVGDPVTFRVVNWNSSDIASDWMIYDENDSTSPDLG